MPASRSRASCVTATRESGSSRLPRQARPRSFVAAAVSASRSARVPRVPISPRVTSSTPTRLPASASLSSVPPRQISASSGCAAMTSASRAMREQLRKRRYLVGEVYDEVFGRQGIDARHELVDPARAVARHELERAAHALLRLAVREQAIGETPVVPPPGSSAVLLHAVQLRRELLDQVPHLVGRALELLGEGAVDGRDGV